VLEDVEVDRVLVLEEPAASDEESEQ